MLENFKSTRILLAEVIRPVVHIQVQIDTLIAANLNACNFITTTHFTIFVYVAMRVSMSSRFLLKLIETGYYCFP